MFKVFLFLVPLTVFSVQANDKDNLVPKKYQIKNFILSTSEYNNFKTIKLDYNRDKKVDRIERWKDKKLISVKEDRDFDGTFDHSITYDLDSQIFKTVLFDNNNDGKTDRKELYTNVDSDKIKIQVFQVEGKKEKLLDTRHVSRTQENNACVDKLDDFRKEITILRGNVQSIVLDISQPIIDIGYGYKVTKSCFEKCGIDNFQEALIGGMSQGLNCMIRLQNNGSNKAQGGVTGAMRNLLKYQSMMKNSSVHITCEETSGYNWSETRAHASTEPGQKTSDGKFSHPFISINPGYPSSASGANMQEKVKDIKNTIFHEQLHNLGIKHGEDVEYPYACADCCMTDRAGADANTRSKLDTACNICTGNYRSGADDINYISDITFYGDYAWKNDLLGRNAQRYSRNHQRSLNGRSILAHSNAHFFSPLGRLIAEKQVLMGHELPELSKKHLRRIREQGQSQVAIDSRPKVEPIADAYIELL